MKGQGVIRAIGVGLNQPRWALRWLAEADLDAVMLAGRLTLLNHESKDKDGVLAACRSRGVAYIAAGAFNGGLLARGSAGDGRFNYRPAPPEIHARYAALVEHADGLAVNLKGAALQFPLRHPEVASLVVGASSVAEVEENFRALREAVPAAFWAALP